MNRVRLPSAARTCANCRSGTSAGALNSGAEKNHQVVFRGQRVAQCVEPPVKLGLLRIRGHAGGDGKLLERGRLLPRGNRHEIPCLASQGLLARIHDVKPRTVVPDGSANLPGHQRILLAGVVAEEQSRGRRGQFAHGGENSAARSAARSAPDRRSARSCPCQIGGQRHQPGIIRGAMVVDVIRAHRRARNASQQVILLIRGAIRAIEPDGVRAVLLVYLGQPRRRLPQRLFPRGRLELAAGADQRLAQALGMPREVECETALGAKEIAVVAGEIALLARIIS